jgi:hypothetical protein
MKLRWTACTVILVLFLFGVAALRNRIVADASASRLIGTWKTSNPQGAGTTRILTFRADGTLESKNISDLSGAILQQTSAKWWIEGRSLILRKSWNRPPDQIPISFVSNEEVTFGTMVYTRKPH